MIPYNVSYVGGREAELVRQAIESRSLSGDGAFTRLCSDWLKTQLQSRFALLTHSATGALEMAALLADLQPGDEVIMPSYTFVSTANAVVLRGAVPVFVDIRADTLNMDERLVAAAITPRTRALMPVHYAGVACEMDTLLALARQHGLLVIEDAAQGIMASYKGQALGTIGDMGALSFHATKNISCGEGGAFLTRVPALAERAEIIREKGTNRSKFFRGEVDKYSWVGTGSSFLPSELNAAYLAAQFEQAREITDRRVAIWDRFHAAFAPLEKSGMVIRPTVPAECQHNGHIYWLLLPTLTQRTAFLQEMKARGVGCTFHYVPLHSAPNGLTSGRVGSDMPYTEDLSERLVRLPLYAGLEPHVDLVIEHALAALRAVVQ
jgi:dTDP-4-amino-4,6-dideoxygalactose transaminase